MDNLKLKDLETIQAALQRDVERFNYYLSNDSAFNNNFLNAKPAFIDGHQYIFSNREHLQRELFIVTDVLEKINDRILAF